MCMYNTIYISLKFLQTSIAMLEMRMGQTILVLASGWFPTDHKEWENKKGRLLYLPLDNQELPWSYYTYQSPDQQRKKMVTIGDNSVITLSRKRSTNSPWYISSCISTEVTLATGLLDEFWNDGERQFEKIGLVTKCNKE